MAVIPNQQQMQNPPTALPPKPTRISAEMPTPFKVLNREARYYQ